MPHRVPRSPVQSSDDTRSTMTSPKRTGPTQRQGLCLPRNHPARRNSIPARLAHRRYAPWTGRPLPIWGNSMRRRRRVQETDTNKRHAAARSHPPSRCRSVSPRHMYAWYRAGGSASAQRLRLTIRGILQRDSQWQGRPVPRQCRHLPRPTVPLRA